MKPSNIKTLGFKFSGGEAAGCLFVEHPANLQEVVKAIEAAKTVMFETRAYRIEMTMIGKDGATAIEDMYANQFAKAPVAQVATVETRVAVDDPYSWSNYN